jgi:hypothetical protein
MKWVGFFCLRVGVGVLIVKKLHVLHHNTKQRRNIQNVTSKSYKPEHRICFLLEFLQRNHLKMTY